MASAERRGMRTYLVAGITCLDCAAKFEKNVARLPGVEKAVLNTATGKLHVSGQVSLDDIRRQGKKEGYRIDEETGQNPVPSKHNWQTIRAALSGASLLGGVLLNRAGGPSTVVLVLYVAAMVVGAWDNAGRAWHSLWRRDLNMSVLMTVAIIGAVAIGEWTEGAVVAFLYAVSEMLESWTLGRVRRSIEKLVDVSPKLARVRRSSGEEAEVPIDEIKTGDTVLVRPGEKIGVDGLILTGHSAVDEAVITGESIPAEKGPNDEVFAGTINTTGYLEIQVTKLAEDTTLAKIIHLVEEAQSNRAPSQAFVDRFAAIYTPIVMALAAAIILLPPLLAGQPWHPWLYRGLALLVVACPCALVVSTPVAIVSAIGSAARHGVLIKGGIYLEETGTLAAIAFDKTGTLTAGRPVVTDVIPWGQRSRYEVLQVAAGLEVQSEHPLAQAVLTAARHNEVAAAKVEDSRALPGRGTKGLMGGESVYLGSPRLFDELGLFSPAVSSTVSQLQEQGKTIMILGTNSQVWGIIAAADQSRPISSAAITAVKQAGIRETILLTGDNRQTAAAIAGQIGVDQFRAELFPADKVSAIKALQQEYGKVAMVGDGINDAPALATADVGIAMGGAGTDAALETADIVLMADDLTKLPFAIRLSRTALKIIRQNISLALAIKAAAVLAVFPGWLSLWLAILADMGATILVTLNAMRLLSIRPNISENVSKLER